MPTAVFRRAATLLTAIPIALWTTGQPALAAEHGQVKGAYVQTNLVSDIPSMAPVFDPNLKNPWGLSASATSPMWVADNNAAASTLYRIAKGAATPISLVVGIPAPGDLPGAAPTGAPTGTVFSASSSFVISENGKSGPTSSSSPPRTGQSSGGTPQWT